MGADQWRALGLLALCGLGVYAFLWVAGAVMWHRDMRELRERVTR